jgi:DNA-binding YbaB/EbfC family protein
MFDIFGDMEKKQQELHKKLEAIIIEHTSEDGKLGVRIDGNKLIKDLKIDPALCGSENKDMLEDLLVVALNKAIGKADERAMEEMQNQLNDFLPDFNGLGSPFTA